MFLWWTGMCCWVACEFIVAVSGCLYGGAGGLFVCLGVAVFAYFDLVDLRICGCFG